MPTARLSVVATWGLGPCMMEIPPPREQTDRQTHTTENITFATPLAEGNDVDKGPFIAKEINRDSESECIL